MWNFIIFLVEITAPLNSSLGQGGICNPSPNSTLLDACSAFSIRLAPVTFNKSRLLPYFASPYFAPHTLRPKLCVPIFCVPIICAPMLCVLTFCSLHFASSYFTSHSLRFHTWHPIICAPHLTPSRYAPL